jgi:pimeloyl-ACP methyl ester carboxylesterase
MKRLFIVFTLLVVGLFGGGVFAQDMPDSVAVRDLEIELDDDFVTQAQLTYPAEGDGPFPLVILVHGSGPYDMDASYRTTLNGEVLSANFRLLAERLSESGIAVLRYNKRGVLADGSYDQAQLQAQMNLDVLVADLETVLDVALEQPEVDAAQVYLYGWSEGTWVTANAATNRPDDIAGLIFQGSPNGDLSAVLEYQEFEIALPYLAEVTDADGDGELTLEEVLTIPSGPVAYMATFFLYNFLSTPDNPLLNTYIDEDNSGTINIETELRPFVEQFVTNYSSFMPETEASHETAELVAALEKPVLILQGESDGWVSSEHAQAIADAAPDYVTLNLYEGLGHALSPVVSLAEDSFGVMDDAPIADLIGWVNGE